MKHFHKIAAMALMMLPAIAGAQNGVNYNYTHTDGVQYSCSVYTDSIIITDATPGFLLSKHKTAMPLLKQPRIPSFADARIRLFPTR